ncbi:cytohesin-1 isoform 1-T1 [Ciconia maguari]
MPAPPPCPGSSASSSVPLPGAGAAPSPPQPGVKARGGLLESACSSSLLLWVHVPPTSPVGGGRGTDTPPHAAALGAPGLLFVSWARPGDAPAPLALLLNPLPAPGCAPPPPPPPVRVAVEPLAPPRAGPRSPPAPRWAREAAAGSPRGRGAAAGTAGNKLVVFVNGLAAPGAGRRGEGPVWHRPRSRHVPPPVAASAPSSRGRGRSGGGGGGGGGMEEEGGYVPSDLTPEECQELENIRRRKQELLADIQRLKDEIAEVTNEIENLGSTEERKNMQRNKQVAMGRKKFNMDPKKGIQFLIENDLLKNTCEDIAQFLYKGEGLNKTAIGDYLGERDEFNIQVLHAFVELHEFTDLNLVQALRQFLWSFRLPGEAQKIDRMMEAFAQRYCQCNPGVFQSTDTCYVLSFAIIMLNTSLHNPNVKDKPTAERFIAMNRGINDGGDLPEELLRNLYESIKNEPFKIPEDDGNDLTHTFFNPDREGWLLKLGGRVKTWKRRWFILTDNCLYYFEYTTDKEPRGIIPLENLSIREVDDSKKPNCFELYIPDNKDQVIKACKTEADGRVVEGNHTVYRISAPTPEEKEEWIKCIKAAISRDPFYEMLAARKKKVSSTKRH